MSDDLPDYRAIEPPDGTPPVEYTHHERRAEILRHLIEAGSPFRVKQVRLADRYDVHESTISRDFDRIRESVGAHLGRDAQMTTRVLFEKTVRELQNEDEWKDAWDVVLDWNDWLGDIGEQHREPQRSEVDMDVDSRNVDVAYTVVREGDGEPLPTTTTGGEERVDYEELGFTSDPAEIDVEAVERGDDSE